MLKLIRKLFKSQKQRTSIVIGTIIVIITAVVIFIEIELEHNRELYVSNYVKQQQFIVKQAAMRMENEMTTDHYDVTHAVHVLVSGERTFGSRYWFVVRNNQLLFVKDEATTKLFKDISLSKFLRNNKAEGRKVSSSSFYIEKNKYTIGICTQEDAIEAKGQFTRHHIYIQLPVILICSFSFVSIVFMVHKINQQENKICELNTEAFHRNVTMEQLSERIKELRLSTQGEEKSHTGDNEKIIYNRKVLASLLKKINVENFVPLSIVIVELNENGNSRETKDYKDIFRSVSKVLECEHVLADLSPGVFAIVLFHTASIQLEQIKETLVHSWALPLRDSGIKVRMGISGIEDHNTDVETVFDIVYRTVRENEVLY